MDFLRNFWPLAFKGVEKKVTSTLVKSIIIHAIIAVVIPTVLAIGVIVVAFVLGFALGEVGVDIATIIGSLVGLVSSFLDLYGIAGIVFSILVFSGVFKKPEDSAETVEPTENNNSDAE